MINEGTFFLREIKTSLTPPSLSTLPHQDDTHMKTDRFQKTHQKVRQSKIERKK